MSKPRGPWFHDRPGGPLARRSRAPRHLRWTGSAGQRLGAFVLVVLAQVPEVPPDMTPPGGDAARDIVGWIRGYALWILVGLFLAGAAIYGFGRSSSNAGAVTGGRSRMIAAVVGAVAVGLAIALINFAFDFGSSVTVNN